MLIQEERITFDARSDVLDSHTIPTVRYSSFRPAGSSSAQTAGVITTLHVHLYASLRCVLNAFGVAYATIYISDSGDDKNDGLSLKTAIYSLKRAKELHGGRNDFSWHFGPRAWKRIQKELSDKKKG